jgi:transcription antitermination factor NusG
MSIPGLGDVASLEEFSGGTGCNTASWYVASTKARHEKKVAVHLQNKRVEVFVPLYKTTHSWKGRRAVVHLPLFPGYVFVHIPLQERMRVLEVPGVIRLIGSKGLPIPVPDAEVEQLRSCLSFGFNAEPIPYLRTGDLVRIVDGPLAGLKGRVVRRERTTRFVLSIDLIMRSVAVNVEASQLQLIRAVNIAAA